MRLLGFRNLAVAALGLGAVVRSSPMPMGGIENREARGAVQERNFILDMLAKQLLNDLEKAASCDGCQAILVVLKGVAELGNSAFVTVFTGLCKASKAEDADVCTGVVAREGPILASDLRSLQLGSYTSTLFCTIFFGLCPYPDVPAFTPSFPKPKPLNSTRPYPSGQTPLQILHISDTHVDTSYTTGASTNCTKPICCRAYTPSDAPGTTTSPAGPFGDAKCDPPQSLEDSMISAIKTLVPNAASALFTGDVVAHDVWLTTQDSVTSDLNSGFGALGKLGITVYPAVGNHDTNPTNAFPATSLTAAFSSSSWTLNTLAQNWQPWIGSAGAASVRADGAYSVLSPLGNGKLRIISFNSIYYYTQNYYSYSTSPQPPTDPSGQLAWLISELQGAEDSGERVWLISHVPPGVGDFFHAQSNYFDQIINRYSATIAAAFYGHTHADQFEISYSDYSTDFRSRKAENAVLASYIAPAVTTLGGGGPSFRVYSVDPVTFAVLDFEQFNADPTASGFQTSGPVWKKFYSAKEAYGGLVSPAVTDARAELSPSFWHKLTDVFTSNDAVFGDYLTRKGRGQVPGSCTGSCKDSEICGLRAGRSESNCGTVTPGVHFAKRWGVEEDADADSNLHGGHHDGHEHGEHGDECEGSRIRNIFAVMTKDSRRFVEEVEREVAKMSR